MSEPRRLHAKLAEVMAEAERIPKAGKAPAAMGGFEFVQVGDAADHIRKALGERKVSMLPTMLQIVNETEHATKSGGTMTTVALVITWTLTDGETGETAVIQSYGVGADTGDKYSGKATTNAMKYALLSGFLLSTGDDVEASDASDRRARRQPREPANGEVVLTSDSVSPDGGLIGTAKASGTDDFELRQTPTGSALPFRLADGRKSWKALARGVLADLIAEYREGIENQRVTVWGAFEDRSFDKKGPDGKPQTITYQVFNLTRLKVGALDLTEPEEPDEEISPAEMDQLFPVTA